MTQACNDKVFMLVGQGFVLDANQEQTRIECKLSTIPGFAVGTAFASGSGMQQPIPNPGDQEALSSAYQVAKLFPAAVKKAAFALRRLPGDAGDAATRPRPVTRRRAGSSSTATSTTTSPASPTGSRSRANLKACGVQAVVWVGSPDPNMENFLNAAKQVGFTPIWVTDPNQYTAAFAKWNGQNGGAANNVYVRQTNVPFELANQVPAVKQYMDLVAKAHGTIGLLGEQSASAFLLWATAVKSCGSNVTAKCVLDAAAAEKNWTGGGLHLPTNPGDNTAPTCGMLMKLTGPNWVKVVPDRQRGLRLQPQVRRQGPRHVGGRRPPSSTPSASRRSSVRSRRSNGRQPRPGGTSRTRMNLLINGLITGAVFAIAASGLVVTYSTSGVFNFAHGALGMLSAYVYWDLRVNDSHTWPLLPKGHWPAPLALAFVLLVFAPLLGALLYRVVIRGLQDTSEIVKLVVPISVLLAAIGLANWVWKPTDSHSIQPFFGADHKVTWFGVVLLWHDLTILFVAVAARGRVCACCSTGRGSACRCARSSTTARCSS